MPACRAAVPAGYSAGMESGGSARHERSRAPTRMHSRSTRRSKRHSQSSVSWASSPNSKPSSSRMRRCSGESVPCSLAMRCFWTQRASSWHGAWNCAAGSARSGEAEPAALQIGIGDSLVGGRAD